MTVPSFDFSKKHLDTKEIMGILPHRYPFLLVDKIIDLDLENGVIIGLKNLTINEAFFQGHFPGTPLMPGVLIVEALAQTGGILVYLKGGRLDKLAVLLSITNAKFRSPVKPGDTLTLKASGIHFGSRAGKVQAEAYVGERLACEVELCFAIVDKDSI
jgi:3-hydroxyacyl-[acyl-carrier-protein] dehydratase